MALEVKNFILMTSSDSCLYIWNGGQETDSAHCTFTCPRSQVKQTFPGSQPSLSLLLQVDLG